MRTFYAALTDSSLKAWVAKMQSDYPDLPEQGWMTPKPLSTRLRSAFKWQWVAFRETVGRWICPWDIED